MTGYGAPELPVHMNGRIYDPLLGRFLSADVLVDGVADLQGYNRYSYVQNRPLSFTDTSGFSKQDPHDNRFLNRSRELQTSDKVSDRFAAMGNGIVGCAIAAYDSIFYIGNRVGEGGRELRAEAWNTLANSNANDAVANVPIQASKYFVGAAFEFGSSATTAIAGTPEHVLDFVAPRVKATGALGNIQQMEGKLEVAAFNAITKTTFDTALEFKSEIASFLADNAGEIFYSAISGNSLDVGVSAAFEKTEFSAQLNLRLDTNLNVPSPFDVEGLLAGGGARNALISSAIGAESTGAKSAVGLGMFALNTLGALQGTINDAITVESDEDRRKRQNGEK